MKVEPNIIKVAVQTPLRRTFDYVKNSDSAVTCLPGQRVIVPFGRRMMTGIVISVGKTSDFPIQKLKPVTDVIDDVPLIDEHLLSLFKWASHYYYHPIGDVILSNLPKKLRQGCAAILKPPKKQTTVESGSNDIVHQLTSEQQAIVTSVLKASTVFQPFLLYGVTGSGKTEVYMHLIDDVINNGKQALILVPEISLTPQTFERFQARFNVPVLLLHSGLGDAARLHNWILATKTSPCIVLGTRSAVFAPLKNLGVIVIDESHDISFKQQSRFRYHARDVAVMRAKMLGIPIVMGSATPSLESYHNALQGKYVLHQLTQRPAGAILPKVTLYDMCNKPCHAGLSTFVVERIQQHLSESGQVLIYLNRRGYAPLMICHHCGWTADCPRCDAKLTVHQFQKRLICHHCAYQRQLPKICESCQQSEVVELGVGTEQLEKILTALFPEKNVARIDRDNVRTVTVLKQVLNDMHQGHIDILIGTQLLVKGHHFENVTLVAAVDVDNALFSSDFRATERLAQSLVQVAGRAGRSKKQGEVIIQTHQPEHPNLQQLFLSNYLEFANSLLKEREIVQLPPFSYMITFRAEGKDKVRVHRFLDYIKACLKSYEGLNILGPLPAAMAKKAGFYRANLCFQATNRALLHHLVSVFLERFSKEKYDSSVRWALDVDPMEMD